MPNLNGDQRALLKALLSAVDGPAPSDTTDAERWQVHVLRASDGSHYVAVSVASTPASPIVAQPLLLYVRLSAITTPPATFAQRSVVREWLGGSRIDPRLLPRRGFAVGEMPSMGAAGSLTRRPEIAEVSSNVAILNMHRDRDQQRKDEQERQRRAGLESAGAGGTDLLPFEDFDVVTPAAIGDGTAVIQRALTAGPGRYRLSIAWIDASAKADRTPVQLAHRLLDLPPALPDEFRLSSMIVADQVSVRRTPYTAIEQRAHPYAIGATEITPARDTVLSSDEPLSLAFQVINATAPDTGKPDVTVNFRITRLAANREHQVATLTPLRYDTTTLPPDFDVRLGHPLIAAMSVPLTTIPRGEYRLHVTATDHASAMSTSTHTDFSVIGTPRSLLSEAPPLGRAFRREDAIDEAVLPALVEGLTPASPSPALRRALDLAARRAFIDLLAEEPVPQREQAARVALTGLALYAIGEASALGQFQRAYALGAPGGPTQLLIGAVLAVQNRDADAIAAWQSAQDEGLAVVTPLLVEAYLRRGDGARAAALVSAELAGKPAAGTWARALAATHLAAGRNQEALTVLDAHLARSPGDADGRWLQLQALYGRIVTDGGADRERFRTAAQAYVASGGAHAALAAEWLKAVP